MKKYLLYNPTNGEWNSDPMTLDEIRSLTTGAEETYVAELLEDGTTGPTITLAPERPNRPPMQRAILETKKNQPAIVTPEQQKTYSLIRTTCRTIILMTCLSVTVGCTFLGAAIVQRDEGFLFGALAGLALVLIGRAIVTD